MGKYFSLWRHDIIKFFPLLASWKESIGYIPVDFPDKWPVLRFQLEQIPEQRVDRQVN